MALKVIFILVILSFQHFVYCLDFNVTATQRCLLSETYFRRLFDVTRNQCVSECSARRRCKYLSHRRTPFQVCHLFEEDFTGSGANGTGTENVICTYVRRSDIITDLSASCNCTEREVCDPDTGSCSYKECNLMEVPAHGIVLGNMNSVGSKVKVECNVGYQEIRDVSYSECGSNGEWSQFPRCVSGSRVICGGKCQGSSYLFVTIKSDRNEAKAECESTGGYLAKITSEEENTVLKEEAEKHNDGHWFGLMRLANGDFAWEDGSSLGEFTDWFEERLPIKGDCVRIRVRFNYHWGTFRCYGNAFYICEYSAE